MDSWVGSGVDQLTILDEKDIKIQLPCHSRNFHLQKPCITETMERGKVLDFLLEDMIPDNPAENMGLMAYFIRLVELRKRVLRLVLPVTQTRNTILSCVFDNTVMSSTWILPLHLGSRRRNYLYLRTAFKTGTVHCPLICIIHLRPFIHAKNPWSLGH